MNVGISPKSTVPLRSVSASAWNSPDCRTAMNAGMSARQIKGQIKGDRQIKGTVNFLEKWAIIVKDHPLSRVIWIDNSFNKPF